MAAAAAGPIGLMLEVLVVCGLVLLVLLVPLPLVLVVLVALQLVIRGLALVLLVLMPLVLVIRGLTPEVFGLVLMVLGGTGAAGAGGIWPGAAATGVTGAATGVTGADDAWPGSDGAGYHAATSWALHIMLVPLLLPPGAREGLATRLPTMLQLSSHTCWA